jgi:hypothetical protein
MSGEQLEFNVGDGEQPTTLQIPVEENESAAPASASTAAQDAAQDAAPRQDKGGELDDYTENVRRRINKLTARLRETERQKEAALDFARQVQAQNSDLQQRYMRSDGDRLAEARSRIDTQAMALKQIIRKARDEGDLDTETEAQQRLAALAVEDSNLRAALAQRENAQAQPPAQPVQQPQYQAPQQPAPVDPRVEAWAERNKWYGRDTVMTHAAWGIHRQLVQAEGFDPSSDEYYDQLDKRIREAFPAKFEDASGSTQSRNRHVQTVAPATRSSGINATARRTVRLSPSQVAIAKKLGVPLEEYAKYVKE